MGKAQHYNESSGSGKRRTALSLQETEGRLAQIGKGKGGNVAAAAVEPA